MFEHTAASLPPLIVHIIFRLDYGGMENGVANVLNGLSPAYRHAVIALTTATDFKQRIRRADVAVYALHKRPGKDLKVYWRLWRLLRQLQPQVVHTRNIGTLDCVWVAWLAGVPVRIHGEHGWDIHDLDGVRLKYRWLRRLCAPFVTEFVTVSVDLQRWLQHTVALPVDKIQSICNGVDTERFQPRKQHVLLPDAMFTDDCWIIGSVTRFMEVKDPLNLVRAFLLLREQSWPNPVKLRLVMLGDGPLRTAAQALVNAVGAAAEVYFPGSRDDVAQWLPNFDLFVLGSRREGISNTVLEAMACGLPVVACATGGNLEIIEADVTGSLVPVGESTALAAAIREYVLKPAMCAAHGAAARARVLEKYSLRTMLQQYDALYHAHCYPAGQ